MPVFIFEPDAFNKICQVEGPEYLENQKTFTKQYTFEGFKEEWEGLSSEVKELDKDMALIVDGNAAIYGWCGWNRYIVHLSGEIFFLDLIAISPRYIELAKKVGFSIR